MNPSRFHGIDDICYYDSPECQGELRQCKICKTWYCEFHFHETDKGRCVECVACEQAKKEQEEL